MIKSNMIELLYDFNEFSRKDLKYKLKEQEISVSDSIISLFLNQMIRQGFLIKDDKNYCVLFKNKKRIYCYNSSNKLTGIENLINEKYPDIKFEIWENIQLNEFINHLITKNTNIVET